MTRSSCAPSNLFGHCFCSFGGCVKENCLRCLCQNLLQLPVPMSESQNCICADESLAVFLLSAEKVTSSVASLPRESLATIPLAPSDLNGKLCSGILLFLTGNNGPPNMFKCEVRSPSFLLSKGFLDASCRAQPRAGCKCIWERLV